MVVVQQRSHRELGTLVLIDRTHDKGRIRCVFTRSLDQVPRAKVPVKASPVYLFMAKGPVENGN